MNLVDTKSNSEKFTPVRIFSFLVPTQTFPFFGVKPELLDENGQIIEGEGEGFLVFNRPWPGIMRTLFGNHKRFEETYFSRFPGYYCTGDGNYKSVLSLYCLPRARTFYKLNFEQKKTKNNKR